MTAFRITCALLLCGTLTSLVEAQQPPPRGGIRGTAPAGGADLQPRQPRPAPPDQRQAVAPAAQPIPPLTDKELIKILDDWGTRSAEVRELRGQHRRYVFDNVFMTEKRAAGNFYYMAPDKGRIDLEPMEIKKDDKSRKEGFKLQPDRRERWICDGFQIITINDDAKEFDKFTLPVELRGKNIINGPLPFLFGLKAVEANQRYQLKLLQHDATKKIAVILAMPRRQDDQANYSEARIILDMNQFLPQAVRLVDPSGNKITEYWFDELQPNGAGLRQAVEKLMGRDPFHPNINGYKTVQKPAELPPGAAPPSQNGLAPAPRNASRGDEGSGRARLE